MEHKIELVCFLFPAEGTEVIVNSINDDFWESKDKRTGELIYGFDIWDWPCF